jgi:hypothetical protein
MDSTSEKARAVQREKIRRNVQRRIIQKRPHRNMKTEIKITKFRFQFHTEIAVFLLPVPPPAFPTVEKRAQPLPIATLSLEAETIHLPAIATMPGAN